MLEWNSVSLVDRSFEEVCSIMDRTGDTVELLVEHATDFRMCDLLDEGTTMNPSSSGGGGVTANTNSRKLSDDPTSGLAPGNLNILLLILFRCFKKQMIAGSIYTIYNSHITIESDCISEIIDIILTHICLLFSHPNQMHFHPKWLHNYVIFE